MPSLPTGSNLRLHSALRAGSVILAGPEQVHLYCGGSIAAHDGQHPALLGSAETLARVTAGCVEAAAEGEKAGPCSSEAAWTAA